LQQAFSTYTIAVCTVKTPDDGQRNCPKHVEFYAENKFEKLVHAVGFIIRSGFTSRDRTVKERFILGHFDPKDEGTKLLQNVGAT